PRWCYCPSSEAKKGAPERHSLLNFDLCLRQLLVAEVAHSGDDHGDAMLVGGLDHLIVAHGAARLDHRRCACLDSRQQTVSEGEERVGSDHAALRQRLGKTSSLGGVLCLAGCDAGGV